MFLVTGDAKLEEEEVAPKPTPENADGGDAAPAAEEEK